MARPPKFTDPDEFEGIANDYFAKCVADDLVPTVNGLGLALGICRDTLLEYGKKPEFSDTVKSVRMRLENEWEQRLAGNSVAGTIFWLKNQGWSDKTEQTITADVNVSGIERRIVHPKD